VLKLVETEWNTMKAAVWHSKGDLRVEEVAEPNPGPGQVKIRIKACGICGSDVHEFREGPFIIPSKAHPLTKKAGGPVILGHELSAEVAELGSSVAGVSRGDRVTVNPLILCGECHYCKRGYYNMCLQLGTAGFAADGGFAEYMVVPAYALHPLPESVTDDMGTFAEPLSVAIHAFQRSRMAIGEVVAVVGAGPIGLLVMQVCQAAGARKVLVVEPIKARRALAEKLGASAVLDPLEGDPGKAVASITEGLRATVAFDCVGTQSSFNTAVNVTGRRGVICVAGLALKPIEVPFLRLWGHEKEITFSSGYQDEFPAALALLAERRVKVEELVSARISLSAIVEEGIKPLMNDPQSRVKVLVYP
jgi:(R,R)-butanediol dehydrogenase / meso-butanediol dehydrogenase / diacetyl reductase